MDSMDSTRTPPKIHRFYRKSMGFGWTMISFGEIYPCRSSLSSCVTCNSVIVSTLFLAHCFVAFTWLKVDAIIPSNTFYICRVIYLQTHILFFLNLVHITITVNLYPHFHLGTIHTPTGLPKYSHNII